jgi:beta-mannosidase
MTYWWDFCPRMVHVGIWDHVYLEISDAVRLEDVFVRPQLHQSLEHAELDLAVKLDSTRDERIAVEVDISLEGDTVNQGRVEKRLERGKTDVSMNIDLDQPQLWWPNGHGAQPLYEAEVQVYSAHNPQVPIAEKTVSFGVRDVAFGPNQTSDQYARSYTLLVNGRKTFLKGWNWVPIDVMYGVERPRKLERLLALAQRAHVNLLRVWGGGLIEKEAFYDECDRRGIMVWQEFSQSSSGIESDLPREPAFIDHMIREARQIIPRKRNHPSLVLWCGGNELSENPEQPLDEDHPLLSALERCVSQLDPDRLWLPTSPTGRLFGNTRKNIEMDPTGLHDVHGPWEYQGLREQYELANRSTSLLHSEFGVEGLTNQKTLNHTIKSQHQTPVSLKNPFWHHLGAWWLKEEMWRKVFGPLEDVPHLVRATQFIQAQGLKYAVESDRRRKYQNSGTLPWQFNEPYPMAACTSAVDYYAHPKPVYHAVAHAYEPVHVSASFPTIAWRGDQRFASTVWVNNSKKERSAGLIARVVGMDGSVYQRWEKDVRIQSNHAQKLQKVEWDWQTLRGSIFFLDLLLKNATGDILSQNRYLFSTSANLAPLFHTDGTELSVSEWEGGSGRWKVKNEGDATALNVWFQDSRERGAVGYLTFHENYFCLFPGEERTIVVQMQEEMQPAPGFEVQGWNTSRYVCDMRRDE